jgi:hypothetical protein
LNQKLWKLSLRLPLLLCRAPLFNQDKTQNPPNQHKSESKDYLKLHN